MTVVAVPEDLSERLRLLEEYRPRAMRAARRCTWNYEDAQDAVQEALLKVALVPIIDWERVGSLVATTTKNLCIDTMRSNSRRARRDAQYFQDESFVPDLGDEVCEQMAAQWLESNLHRLTATEQQILRLSIDGSNINEIASRVGLSYKGTHAALTRARKRMHGFWRAALVGLVTVGFKTKARRLAVAAACVVGLGVSVALAPNVKSPELRASVPIFTRANLVPSVGSSRAAAALQTRSAVQGIVGVRSDPPPPRHVIRRTVVHRIPNDGFVNPLSPLTLAYWNDPDFIVDAVRRCLQHGILSGFAHLGCDPTE